MANKMVRGIQTNVIPLFAALFIAIIVKTSIAEPYQVTSSSMENTVMTGDFVISNKFLYGARIPFTGYRLPAIRDPKPGDIITFKWPGDRKTIYVKRCVGVAGQIVEIKNKQLYVDGVKFPNPQYSQFLDTDPVMTPDDRRDNFGPYRVPAGTVFAMGDNRDNSYDSRYWGPVPLDLIDGKVILVPWSVRPDSTVPALDPADLSSIPNHVWHGATHLPGRIRWERLLHGVD
jgi:signal peptidase I